MRNRGKAWSLTRSSEIDCCILICVVVFLSFTPPGSFKLSRNYGNATTGHYSRGHTWSCECGNRSEMRLFVGLIRHRFSNPNLRRRRSSKLTLTLSSFAIPTATGLLKLILAINPLRSLPMINDIISPHPLPEYKLQREVAAKTLKLVKDKVFFNFVQSIFWIFYEHGNTNGELIIRV